VNNVKINNQMDSFESFCSLQYLLVAQFVLVEEPHKQFYGKHSICVVANSIILGKTRLSIDLSDLEMHFENNKQLQQCQCHTDGLRLASI